MGALESTIELPAGVELTTARAESSYGIPVLVVDGIAHGRADTTPRGPAVEIVAKWAQEPGRTQDERDFARRFGGV